MRQSVETELNLTVQARRIGIEISEKAVKSLKSDGIGDIEVKPEHTLEIPKNLGESVSKARIGVVC